jgi:exodeoxyribonuclease VII large subunit
VKERLAPEGLFDLERKRPLPSWPECIALLTSVPSSALADMLRTARERWPATRLLVVPIPVQGAVEDRIRAAVEDLGERVERFGVEALVLARGGGSREDLTVFDGEALARSLAAAPVPVVCGLGHEDDTTIADLVADYRAATPTAALVALLPDHAGARDTLLQRRRHLSEVAMLRLRNWRAELQRQRTQLQELHPRLQLSRLRRELSQQVRVLRALSPSHLLERGFSLLRDRRGRLVRSIHQLHAGDGIAVQVHDGIVRARVDELEAGPPCQPEQEPPS